MTGLDPGAIGSEIRIGQLGRENAKTKARRLLVEGRVLIRRVDDQGIFAMVRGDSASMRTVNLDARSSAWSCDCSARGEGCSHIRAVKLVTLAPQPLDAA